MMINCVLILLNNVVSLPRGFMFGQEIQSGKVPRGWKAYASIGKFSNSSSSVLMSLSPGNCFKALHPHMLNGPVVDVVIGWTGTGPNPKAGRPSQPLVVLKNNGGDDLLAHVLWVMELEFISWPLDSNAPDFEQKKFFATKPSLVNKRYSLVPSLGDPHEFAPSVSKKVCAHHHKYLP